MSKVPTPNKQQIEIVAKRAKGSPLWAGVSVVAFVICSIPVLGAAGAFIAHMGDRVANGGRANDELKLRADYYRNIVAQKLGMDPAKVGVKEFLTVARNDPTFSKVVEDVYAKRDRANRESAMINTGVAAATMLPIPGLGGVAHLAGEATTAAKVGAHAIDFVVKPGLGQLAGSATSSIFNKDKVSAQEVVERIDQCLLDAQQSGKPTKGAVTPQLVFLLRVAQDEAFGEEIKKQYGKPYQKLEPAQQLQVMQAYPALANAATSEAYAVSNGMLTPQDLAAKSPNLNSNANRYAIGTQNSSFAEALRAQRAQAAANPSQALAT